LSGYVLVTRRETVGEVIAEVEGLTANLSKTEKEQ
jgi:hypothetical protein